MSNIVLVQATKLAQSLGMDGDGSDLVATLKATAFKGQVTDAQMAALLIVANQYGLSPWTKEIYAFPDKNNGIVPVVGVDGWARIINSHPQYDGVEFEQDGDSCTCILYRKDRGHPTRVTEYMVECRRANVGPWTSHPYRMLRHKAMIQCARLAFGFVGIYEQDEAERIVESIDGTTGEISTTARKPAVAMPQARAKAPPTRQDDASEPTDVTPKGEEPPAAREPSGGESAELCSPGEIAFITRKLTGHKVSIAEARAAVGMDAGETLDGLTKDWFVSLKDAYK